MGNKSAPGHGPVLDGPPGPVPAPAAGTGGVPNSARRRHKHGRHPHIELKFLEELKHRNVVRVALLYLVACWLILEPTHVVFHMLDVPAWANRLVLILMTIGLPGVMLFAWAFEITPEGLRPTVEVDPVKSIRTRTGHRLDRAIIVVLALALAYFVADKFWLARHPATSEVREMAKPSAAAPSSLAKVAAREQSIAVLPFVDMSEKRDQEYFADGMAEEILDLLTKVPQLHVPARTSSFYFKGRQSTIAEISHALGVAHVLEGSVRKAGNTMRVTAQLVRADNGFHLWSQTYDRKLDDVFKVQDEIAGAVVKALKVSLLSDAMPKAAATDNVEAYTLYLQARSIWMRMGTPADFEKMADYLQQAIKSDPTFAPSWAFLSIARSNQAQIAGDPDRWEQARLAAKKAIALDPTLPVAHTSMAFIQIVYDWDWVGAQAQVTQALELEPNNWFALLWAGRLAERLGQFDQALEFFQRAIADDPLNFLGYLDLGVVRYATGRPVEALVAFRKSLDLNPVQLGGGHTLIGLVLLENGDPAPALAEFELGSEYFRQPGRALAYQALGRKADADAALASLEKGYAGKDAYFIAEVRSYRGEIDEAFTWLERARRQHDRACGRIKLDPLLKNLQADPRFKALVKKMNLPG
jgi:adenylate cyclase